MLGPAPKQSAVRAAEQMPAALITALLTSATGGDSWAQFWHWILGGQEKGRGNQAGKTTDAVFRSSWGAFLGLSDKSSPWTAEPQKQFGMGNATLGFCMWMRPTSTTCDQATPLQCDPSRRQQNDFNCRHVCSSMTLFWGSVRLSHSHLEGLTHQWLCLSLRQVWCTKWCGPDAGFKSLRRLLGSPSK